MRCILVARSALIEMTLPSGKRMFQAKTELLSPIKASTGVVKPELEFIVTLDQS